MLTIAMDGPGGAGKSNVADDVARALDILHLDTGAMYRAFALAALRRGVDTSDEQAVSALAQSVAIGIDFRQGKQHTMLGSEDVSELIRTPEIGMAASNTSKYPTVRKRMVALQRELAKAQPMILDGRDIGTNVLKDATLKIFLTATAQVRAKRRQLQLEQKGETVDYDALLEQIKARDHQDMTRQLDPLMAAPDAVTIDTSDMTQAQVVQKILTLVKERV